MECLIVRYNIMNYGEDNKSAIQAKYDAQKIIFGPIMFQAALAMRNLGILETLKKSRTGMKINEVAEKLGLSEYGVKVLLEAGLSMGLVYLKDDYYLLAKTGFFILSDPMTRVNMDFVNDVNYLGMFHLQESVEKGKPVGLRVFGGWNTIYEALKDLPEEVKNSWFAFDHFYSDIAFPDVLPIIFKNKPGNILDVGGNTGKFATACVAFNDDVRVTILDLPGQIEEAKIQIERQNLGKRIDYREANLLDPEYAFPENYDGVWMSQFLDCFSKTEILSLLERAKRALSKRGSLYILETYWDNQKFEASTYSLHATSLYFTCMANGNSQMYHTRDMLELIEQAGLKVTEYFPGIGLSHTLFRCVKK